MMNCRWVFPTTVLLILGYVVFVMIVLSSCSYINKKLGLPDDNLGEEIIEEVIDKETGIDVDLTPATPEKK